MGTIVEIKFFIYLLLSFILATIIGTLSHELGHYFVAEWMGYDAVIHYGSTGFDWSNNDKEWSDAADLWITFGGPLQTWLTGTIGLILIFIFRKSFLEKTKLAVWQWLLIFLSLFWLRQPANLVTWIIGYFRRGHFSKHGDEVELAVHFNLPNWSLVVFTALIGIGVLSIVTFKFIPKSQRFTFLTAGLCGGIAGYFIWLKALGKIVLP